MLWLVVVVVVGCCWLLVVVVGGCWLLLLLVVVGCCCCFLHTDALVGCWSCPTLVNPRTVAHQAPPFMGFPRQEDWSGLAFPSFTI